MPVERSKGINQSSAAKAKFFRAKQVGGDMNYHLTIVAADPFLIANAAFQRVLGGGSLVHDPLIHFRKARIIVDGTCLARFRMSTAPLAWRLLGLTFAAFTD